MMIAIYLTGYTNKRKVTEYTKNLIVETEVVPDIRNVMSRSHQIKSSTTSILPLTRNQASAGLF